MCLSWALLRKLSRDSSPKSSTKMSHIKTPKVKKRFSRAPIDYFAEEKAAEGLFTSRIIHLYYDIKYMHLFTY